MWSHAIIISRDEVFDLCHRAHLSVSVERGHGLTRDLAHTRLADILIACWDRGKPAALDLTITSHHSALSSWVNHVTRLVRQPWQQRPASSTPKDPSAKSWAGPAFHWQ